MGTTFFSLISLFISCFVLLLGNGLMNVLMPVRMELDGVGTDMIGLVQSLYFVGLLLGAIYSKNLIMRAGHILMFAGCVSLGAASILICSLFDDSRVWGGMRLLLGFCNACAFTAMESWLSDASSKETRGKVLAIYNAVVLSGLFVGQFLMNLADPATATLFVVGGMLLTLAVIPIVMSRHSGPMIEEVATMSLVALYRVSPLGVVSCLISGLIYSAAFNLLPVFAKEYNIVDFQLSLYVGVAILGAFLLQFPVGYLSDRFDRRSVLLCLLVISSGACLSVAITAPLGLIWAVFVSTAVTCGIIACTYPISISEAFDKLRQSEMVAAMGSMILAFSIGGIIGPYSASLVMNALGNTALFYFLAAIQLALAGFVIYRMTASVALPVEDQESFVMQGAGLPAMVDLDPRTEYVETEQPMSAEAETLVNLAQNDAAEAIVMAQAIVRNNPEQAIEVAGAVASVTDMDVLALYDAMNEVVPEQMDDVMQAIVTAQPELGYTLVSHLAASNPENVVDVAAQIGQELPELRNDMARIASETTPEAAVEVAEHYAQLLAEEHEAMRPADREDATTETDAAEIANEIWDVVPEQAVDVATTFADAVPESAVPVTEGLLSGNLLDGAEDIRTGDSAPRSSLEQLEEAYQQRAKLASRMAEVAPEQAVDVAVVLVEDEPESAVEVATEVVSALSESVDTDSSDTSVAASDDEEALASNVELASRLAEVAPEQAVDVAVVVVEDQPEVAAEVAAEVASTLNEANEASDDDAPTVEDDQMPTSVELASRLAEAAPEQAVDVAVAVAEVEPEMAADIAAELTNTDTDETALAEAADDSEGDVSAEHEAAVELVQRLGEVAPDNVVDVAVAVVENIPEVASDVVDAISAGDESRDEEWMNSVDDKPAS